MRVHRITACVVGTILLACGSGWAQQLGQVPPPLPHALLRQMSSDPAAWRQFVAQHTKPLATAAVPQPPRRLAAAVAAPPGWQSVWPGMSLSNPLLLTDGTVMAHVACTGYWFRLTPDINGSYANGTWAPTAPMPGGYAPLYFASGVLPDGRVIVEGGEYTGVNCSGDGFTNQGAIYDPQTDAWTAVAPPPGWTEIGDASSIVLPDGRFMLADAFGTDAAVLDPVSLTWTPMGSRKYDTNDEENWTLLPNGDVLTVNADYNAAGDTNPPCNMSSELFSPATGLWTSAGSTQRHLTDCYGPFSTYEAPTQILMPSGKVQAFGATVSTPSRDAPVFTASYDVQTGRWGAGPNMPQVGGVNYAMSDAPAAVLPNGSVLIAASPGAWTQANTFPPPTHFFIFDGKTFTPVADVPDSPNIASYEMNFLVLPTGEILGVETDVANSEIFPAMCCAIPAWQPTITALSSLVLTPGGSYSLTGTQLSGRTQGASYGDDEQADTNFPLVRIVNEATGHVFYARTTGFGRSVAPRAVSSTNFAVPAGIETGHSKLYVVANGIASPGRWVLIK